MRAIDLHVHSTCSDGTDSPSTIVTLACSRNLAAFALTDHDTTEGLEEVLFAAKDKDIEIISGIEFSTEYLNRDIHILGLYINPYNPAFQEHIRSFRKSRDLRNRKMCLRLAQLGIDITYESLCESFEGSILTRAHYARYLYEHGYVKSLKEAFERYVGDHCPAFVPREKITPAEAVQLILNAGGIPVLAHPILYRFSDRVLETLVSELKDAGLMGIETVYSTYAPSEERYIRRLAAKYDLLITGGSDYHGANKPDISLGNGRGHLFVPEEYLTKIKQAYLKRFACPPGEKAILFFDLDGTLLNDDKNISPDTMDALRACVYAGHRFAISSGRSSVSIRRIIERLHLEDLNPLISAFNGSQITDYAANKELCSTKLPLTVVEKVRTITQKMGLHLQSYSDTTLLTESENEELAFYLKWTGMNYSLLSNLATDGPAPYKLLVINLHNKGLLDECKKQIEELCGDETDCVFSNDYFLEILPKGVSKGSALEYLCNYTGIPLRHSYAFADAENDVSMLRAAGHGVALLNAQSFAKAEADYITFRDNNHDGLTDFLQKLTENRK